MLEGGAGQGADTMFKFELNYAGVFRVENFPPEQVQPVIMIEGSANIVSLRAPNRCGRGARRVISAALYRSDRFSGALSAKTGCSRRPTAATDGLIFRRERSQAGVGSGQIAKPDRIARRRFRYIAREAALLAGSIGRLAPRPVDIARSKHCVCGLASSTASSKSKRPLTTAHQLAIDLDQDLRVEQCAMPDPPRAIDAVAVTQSVEAVRLSGMLFSRERQRVDDPVHADRGEAELRQFRIHEAHIEIGVVDDEIRIADEGRKSSTILAKTGLSAEPRRCGHGRAPRPQAHRARD